MIVLVGFMGAGKSSVGRALASRLQRPFVDTDRLIEERAGTTIRAIFEQAGEPGFRELEREVVAQALAGEDAIVALGGGALGDPATCAALEWTTVVHLDVAFPQAMRRVGGDVDRPLLETGDPRALYDKRRALYERVADHVIATDDRSVDKVVAELVARLEPAPAQPEPPPSEKQVPTEIDRVVVDVPNRRHEIVIAPRLLDLAADVLPDLPGCEQVFVVTHESLTARAQPLMDSLQKRGLSVTVLSVAEGETTKSLAEATALYERLAAAHAHRRDAVVAFGGGVVTDLGGFVASTFNRGLPLINVPTTLLGQVDAAIGGKNAVNLPQAKNQIGTFYQPVAVLCDVDLLASLPEEEIRSGLGEVVKCGLIADSVLLRLVTDRARDLFKLERDILAQVIVHAVRVKAAIVAKDPYDDRGPRANLNYGHTVGHAIESAEGYGRVKHGEAVALGMMTAAYIAQELGRIGERVVELHRRALQAVGLPTRAALDYAELEQRWRHDKKYEHGVRFVLLTEEGSPSGAVARPESGVEVPKEVLVQAVKRMAQ